jgi:hypothetical protein
MTERFVMRAPLRAWAAAWMALTAVAGCDVNQTGLDSARSVSAVPAAGETPAPAPSPPSSPPSSSPASPPSIDPPPPAAPPVPDPVVAPPVDPIEPTPPVSPPPVSGPADCALGDEPVRVSMRSATPSGDLAFDAEGYLVLVEGRHIARMAKGEAPVPFIRNALATGRSLFGMCVGAEGSVYFTDSQSDTLFRSDGAGATRSFPLDRPIEMVQGPTGNIYITTLQGELFSLDPQSGQSTVAARVTGSLRGLTFSPDHRILYVAERDGRTLRSFEVRPDGTLGPMRMFARGLGAGLDGLAVDACGNVYVADREGGPLVRVTPAGQIQTVTESDGPLSALAFGSGRQGWDARSLYAVSEGRGGLYEIKLDVPGPPPLPGSD